jgi:hypothetical protein
MPGEDVEQPPRIPDHPGTFERMQEHLRAVPFPVWFRPFVEYEARATVLRGFEHVLVPGLAQTAEYARAVLATQPNTTEGRVEEFVTARLEPQVVLDRDQPPLLWLVIDEAVLHREVGGAKVMHDQLVHLAELSERPNITVEVMPDTSGAHSGLLGAVAIAEFADAPSVVYLETAAGGQIAEAPPSGVPRMYFTTVPEPKPAKNRIHLDLIPPGDDQQAEVARLTGLGATVLDGQPPGVSWIVMADPEGNEFCLEG